MNEFTVALDFIRSMSKLEMNYKDYFTVVIMLVGALVTFYFIYLLLSGAMNGIFDGGGDFGPPFG